MVGLTCTYRYTSMHARARPSKGTQSTQAHLKHPAKVRVSNIYKNSHRSRRNAEGHQNNTCKGNRSKQKQRHPGTGTTSKKEDQKRRKRKIKTGDEQYQGFARAHAPYYWPGSTQLNFRDRTRPGAVCVK